MHLDSLQQAMNVFATDVSSDSLNQVVTADVNEENQTAPQLVV
jgi:hypothetical protein